MWIATIVVLKYQRVKKISVLKPCLACYLRLVENLLKDNQISLNVWQQPLGNVPWRRSFIASQFSDGNSLPHFQSANYYRQRACISTDPFTTPPVVIVTLFSRAPSPLSFDVPRVFRNSQLVRSSWEDWLASYYLYWKAPFLMWFWRRCRLLLEKNS